MDLQKLSTQYGVSVDEVRLRWLTLRTAMWKADFRLFCREVVKIRTKESQVESLILNSAQEILLTAAEQQLAEESWVRLIGLKGRRQGFSTMVAARGYWRATLWDQQRIYILSHLDTTTTVLFGMVDLMQQHNPFPPAVGTDNAKTLEFKKRGSSYAVATAGQKAGGHGAALSFFHGSEVSRWPNAPEHFSGAVQAVDEVRGRWGVLWRRPPKPLPFEAAAPEVIEGWAKAPSEIWLESTSAGPSGEFHSRYMAAMKKQGRYRHVFVKWTEQGEEYSSPGEFTPDTEPEEEGGISEAEYQRLKGLTDGQMLWRRDKIQELGNLGKFREQYPLDVAEAFTDSDVTNALIKPSLLLRARNRKMDTPDAPLIIGVDPAGAGGDRFAVAWRRGDKVLKVEYRHKLEHDDAVAWLASIIDEDKPNRMCIDRGSMGQNIISSLRGQSKRYADVIKGIDFGAKSKAKTANPNRAGPWNKRAEMYEDARIWMVEGGCIPDDDDLVSDFAAQRIKYRANNDWLLKSKVDLKNDGVRSSDLSDAVVLTFGVREYFEDWSKPKTVDDYGSWTVAGEFQDDFAASGDQGWMS